MMAVLIILLLATLLARLLGVFGLSLFDSWVAATRAGLSVMFLFTAFAHFNSMRHDLARMLPPSVPRPLAVIYLTGVCEVLGAIGLQIPSTRIPAAAALILFLIAVLPANIHAARSGLTLRGKPATPLMVRIPIQCLFISLILWSGIIHPS